MKFEFLKMSGAGNDFIVLDNLDGSYDGILTADLIRRICTRGLHVGADGVLELRSDEKFAFRMKYYNSDGGEAEMCGNGGRCISQFAHMKGLVEKDSQFHFRSDAGVHRAVVISRNEARIWMTDPEIHFLQKEMELKSGCHEVSFINTGVPHAVMITSGPEEPPFASASRELRWHGDFQPDGANVDYLWDTPEGLRIRTWERGVEGETLACGTGAVACAICAVEIMGVQLPLSMVTRSGRALEVGMDDNGWWLQGEARPVYSALLLDDTSNDLTEPR